MKLKVFPPIDNDKYLTKHEKLLELLEANFRNLWTPYMCEKELEHQLNEVLRSIRYNKKIKQLLEED